MKFKKNSKTIIHIETPKIRKKICKGGSVMNPAKGGAYKRNKRVNPEE